jgi:uncharacterized protein (TIGR02145 family)
MVLRFSMLAVALFFISCTDVEFNNPDDKRSDNYHGGGVSSSAMSAEVSSSGTTVPSSSSDSKVENKCGNRTEVFDSDLYKCVDDRGVSKIYLKTPVSYGNESYEAVLIGTQTWLARNLNYEPSIGNFKCYSNNSKNCDTYGLLYDWATAMDLSSSCLNLSCSYSLPRKGICPEGWHLPSDADWDALITAVGGSSTAYGYLKATSGWDYSHISQNNNDNGTDAYGFSALPGGASSFYSTGEYGVWWSASENVANSAYYLRIGHYNNVNSSSNKSELYSVRCLQD